MKPLALMIYLLIAAVPGYFGVHYLLEVRAYLAGAVTTDARISGYQFENIGTADHADNDFRLWVAFNLRDGTAVTAPTNLLGSNDLHRIGETITVHYRPSHIATVRVDSFMSLYLLPTVFLGLATLIVVIGAWRSR